MARQCSRLLRLGFTSMSCLFERGSGGGAPFRTTAHKWSCRRFTAAPPPPPRRSADRRTRVTMGRILTGTMLGVVIAGGAYVSTADEATFRSDAHHEANGEGGPNADSSAATPAGGQSQASAAEPAPEP